MDEGNYADYSWPIVDRDHAGIGGIETSGVRVVYEIVWGTPDYIFSVIAKRS